jgi:hypothetical protein
MMSKGEISTKFLSTAPLRAGVMGLEDKLAQTKLQWRLIGAVQANQFYLGRGMHFENDVKTHAI